jgi:AraC-like DNA-binding protein
MYTRTSNVERRGAQTVHATKFVESYFDAWNHCDPQGVADHLTADGIYVDVPENIERTHDELIVNLNDFFSEFPGRYELLGDVLTSRNTIAFQYRACAMDSSQTLYCGAEFMTLDGDAAVTIADYYEIPAMKSKNKYAKSGLRDEQIQEYMRRLERVMRSEQIYMDSRLTLPALAQTVGCSVNHLSQVINAGFEMSFFDYLNSHRVRHAKELLIELNGKNCAILNIAFTVGFNSNSAFYAAFKKHVGMTPAQFRRSRRG